MASSDINILLLIPIIGSFVDSEDWTAVFFKSAQYWTNLSLLNQILIFAHLRHDNLNWIHLAQALRRRAVTIAINVAVIILLKTLGKMVYDNTTLPLAVAYCLCQITENRGDNRENDRAVVTAMPSTISYGTGMACSFFEGYLTYILPNDGYKFYGLEETLRLFESVHTVRFPVKKMFIIITKSLYSPPSLAEFNKDDRRKPFLEACRSLQEQARDVAGVKDRIYKNTVYLINRPRASPIYLAAECATPLLTLHRIKRQREIYKELANADFDRIVKEFCATLENILAASPECRGKCALVHYDDTNPKENLAEVLIDKIAEIAPNYEDLMNIED